MHVFVVCLTPVNAPLTKGLQQSIRSMNHHHYVANHGRRNRQPVLANE